MASVTAATSPGERNWIISLLCAGHLYSHFVMLCLQPMFLIMQADLGVSFAKLGALVSIMAVTTGFGQIPMGFLVDKIGGRSILLAGIGLMSVSLLAAGFVESYWALFVLFGLAGIGNAVFHPADYAILSARLPSSIFGRAVSAHTFTGYIGWALAAAIMLPLAAWAGWRTALVLVGIAGVLITFLMVLRSSVLDDRAALAQRESTNAGSPQSPNWRQGVSVMMSAPMIMMFLFFSLTAIGTAGLMSFSVVALVTHHGIDKFLAAGLLTAHLVGSAGGVLLGGWLADSSRRHNLVTSLAIIAMAILIAILAVPALTATVIALILVSAGIAYGISSPSRDVIVKRSTPASSTGVAFGFTSAGLSVGNFLGPIICGYLMDVGRPDIFFLGLAAIIGFSIVTVIFTRMGTEA